MPYTRVWDFIPDNSKAAFHASSSVYFELDLTDPYTISGLASCQMLPHGENLQDVLPRELYRRLKRHLDYIKLMLPHWMTPDQRGKGLYADYLFNAIAGNWERKRPVWVMLMVNSLTETDIRSRGVPVLDLYLAQEAERMKKKTGAVERVEEQCHPLNGLNFSQVRRLPGLMCYPSMWAPFSLHIHQLVGVNPKPAAVGWSLMGLSSFCVGLPVHPHADQCCLQKPCDVRGERCVWIMCIVYLRGKCPGCECVCLLACLW